MSGNATISTDFLRRFALVTALVGALLVAPAVAQAPGLDVLDTIDRGSWSIKFRDGSSEQRVCLRSGNELIQIRHSQSGCDHYTVENSPKRLTVQYTCAGHGHGRTTLRKESSRLVQVQSQGIVDGQPFDIAGEARRVGGC